MHVGLFAYGGDLDAGDELDAGRAAGHADRFTRGDGIVIGDAEHRDAGGGGARDELGWGAAAV